MKYCYMWIISSLGEVSTNATLLHFLMTLHPLGCSSVHSARRNDWWLLCCYPYVPIPRKAWLVDSCYTINLTTSFHRCRNDFWSLKNPTFFPFASWIGRPPSPWRSLRRLSWSWRQPRSRRWNQSSERKERRSHSESTHSPGQTSNGSKKEREVRLDNTIRICL